MRCLAEAARCCRHSSECWSASSGGRMLCCWPQGLSEAGSRLGRCKDSFRERVSAMLEGELPAPWR